TPLLWAARGGASSVVAMLMKDQRGMDHRDEDGHTALSLAASLGHIRVARLLLESKALLGNSFKPPLTLAAEKGHRNVVEMLLDHGVDYRMLLENGDTALHRAAAKGHSEVVQVLLPHFKNDGVLNHKNRAGQIPLFVAVCGGHADVVKVLAAAGADAKIAAPVANADVEQTPLSRAVADQDWSVIHALLASKAGLGPYKPKPLLAGAIKREEWQTIDLSFQQPDITPPASTLGPLLYQAARQGKVSVVVRVVEKDPNVAHTLDHESHQPTPLAWAVRGGHAEVVKVLLRYGANPNQQDGEGKTHLMRAIEAGKDEVAAVLLKVPGVDTRSKDSESTTLLARASERGMAPVVAMLARNGGGVNLMNDVATGRTALSIASELGNPPVIDGLLKGLKKSEGRVSVDLADSDGKTPLCWAAEKGYAPVVERLIDIKASVNTKTKEGWTPLHYAAQSSRGKVVAILLNKYADANAATDDGITPLIAA
ncbi:ankyrin repeat-containing domain protein, partial [Chaetomium tenue]